MQKLYFLLILLSLCLSVSAQQSLNMQLHGNWDDNSLPNRSGIYYNDIWGYEQNGREYAILGTVVGTIFMDVTDPANPVEVGRIDGGYTRSLWRDFKTYGHYAYGVADETSSANPSGLQIFDLSGLPNQVIKVYDSNFFFETAHNIFVDEYSGRLYVVGSNTRRNGIIVLDISSNPASPSLLASVNLPGGYIHDVYVRKDTAYCSHGWNGLYVYDLKTPTTPTTLMTYSSYTNQGYNHSSWLTTDGDHLIFADESHNRYLKVLNIADLNNPTLVGTIKSTLLSPVATNSIAHNPFIKGDSVYISYYHEGVQVYDITNPAQPINVSYYDTDFTNTNYNGYKGCWGVYPFLPSGRLIASDIATGLYVIEPVAQVLALGGLALQAQSTEAGVALRWQDDEFSEFVAFEVQRAAPGEAFQTIRRLDYRGPGASYHWLDALPLAGEASYRLLGTDASGNRSFSQEVLVRFAYSGNRFSAFPNPAMRTQRVQLRFGRQVAGRASVQLLSASGQRVWQQQWLLEGGSSVRELDVSGYAAGMYVLVVTDEAGRYVERLELR